MSKNTNKKSRKTRCDKFPLTLHRTGQYCKKIKGKIYYFGADKKLALQKYLEQASYLHLNKGKEPVSSSDIAIKMLCNLYLDHQESRVNSGEIKRRQLYDQTRLLKPFVRFCGTSLVVSEISTLKLQEYRKKLVNASKSPNTINNYISVVKAMYNWALDNEIINSIPNLKAIKKITAVRQEKQVFSEDEIKKILDLANDKMKAMILLGLNCGFGCTDCSELEWKNIDLKNTRINFARTKTGVGRNLPLWKETVVALTKLTRKRDFVFVTSKGNKYVRVVKKEYPDGAVKLLNYNSISKEFSKLLKDADIKTEKGTGFYTWPAPQKLIQF